MYSSRLYKYRDSYVLYIPTVHTFGTLTLHTLFWYRHPHMTFPPTFLSDLHSTGDNAFTIIQSKHL